MKKYSDPCDPKGLIFEAYNIPEISEKDCRVIFFDWAISVSENRNAFDDINMLYRKYVEIKKNHPMTEVLREGLANLSKKQKKRSRGS